MRFYTIGHSTRGADEFIALLVEYGVRELVDVRTVPRSRHNPQFNRDTLPATLEHAGIDYRHMPALGGLRKPRPDSINQGWRNTSFRGYADHMQTDTFRDAIDELLACASRQSGVAPAEPRLVAVMCAEAVPWRCHRSLIADALLARGYEVLHIMDRGKARPHELTRFAEVTGSHVTYPFSLQ